MYLHTHKHKLDFKESAVINTRKICKMSQGDYAQCGFPACEKNVTKKSGGVCCARCLVWFHLSCAKISHEELNFLTKSKGKFFYECPSCSSTGTDVADLRNEFRSSNASTQLKLDALLEKVGSYDNQIKKLNEEVSSCSKLIKHVDETASAKIKKLEDQYEVLQKRFNKLDIIVNGLPRDKIDIKKTVFTIFKSINVITTENDINTCCYINNRNSVLVKFNFLSKKDEVMRNYFKIQNLFEDDIFKNGSKKRIFLNDHLTEKGAKLCRLCRSLRKNNIISKYRILNSDLPRVKIHFNDTTEKIFEYEECFDHFKNSEQMEVINNNITQNHSSQNITKKSRKIKTGSTDINDKNTSDESLLLFEAGINKNTCTTSSTVYCHSRRNDGGVNTADE